MTFEEKKRIEQQRQDEFVNKFRNTALEPYAVDIYKWCTTAAMSSQDSEKLEKDQQSIMRKVKHCHLLSTILRDLRNKEIRWRDEVVTDMHIPLSAELIVQSDLVTQIGKTGYAISVSDYFEPLVIEAIKVKWGEALSWLPLKGDFEYETDGRFTEESFSYAEERIEKSYVASQKLFSLTNELRIRAFLKYVKSLISPLNNAVYRQVYRCLEIYGWIPDEILHCHNTSTSRYVRENYIKSKFLHLKDDDFDWDEFLVDAIDPDFLDPRK